MHCQSVGSGSGGYSTLTWVARSAVGTHAVSRHRLDEFLQRPLVTRLLALVQDGGHLSLVKSIPVEMRYARAGCKGRTEP